VHISRNQLSTGRSIVVLGSHYEVVRVALSDGTEGECRADSAQLCVGESIAPGRRWSVLRHELGHAVWFESGCRAALRFAGYSDEQADALEEAVMEIFIPAYVDTLERAGWLLVPVIA